MTLMLTHNCVLSRTHKHTHTHTLTHYTKEADEASKPLMLQNIFTLPRAQCCVHGHEWRDLASFESQEGGGLHVCVWGGSTEHAGKFNELEVDPSEVCNVAERFHAGTAAATALSPLRAHLSDGSAVVVFGGLLLWLVYSGGRHWPTETWSIMGCSNPSFIGFSYGPSNLCAVRTKYLRWRFPVCASFCLCAGFCAQLMWSANMRPLSRVFFITST